MISSQGLCFRHAGGPTIAFADLSLAQGSPLLVRGPSGSGKSTWLALVAGLLRPQAGVLQVAGVELTGLSAAQRDAWRAQHLGFLPQRLHLSEALDVHGNLALAFLAAGRNVDESRIAQVLDRMGIAALSRRKPSQLSGGQAQRVALARAMMLSPSVLVADEPTSSLDDDTAREALQLLLQTAREAGTTLAVATHDARVVAAMGDAQVYGLPPLAPQVAV